jgi:hypothetical protein
MRPPPRSGYRITLPEPVMAATQASRGGMDAATRPSSAESEKPLDAHAQTALTSLLASDV